MTTSHQEDLATYLSFFQENATHQFVKNLDKDCEIRIDYRGNFIVMKKEEVLLITTDSNLAAEYYDNILLQ